ncbi:hypothetical protein [Mesomycoplasma hyopneumoniae]|uniref:ICEF Integrative Conjugal Element-IIC n=1 Tax=Mesomycoplasma hyopneumoniae (strain 7448) TaxID=262722 RepID=Q4A7U7_MESH7|nr:hypothetical protein [Mesomycoplasma hyopneumoniae]AAZ53792.1 putative ICEF Integrative Conjugal Element - IIC [Mesomycoplasma hyopneumoniae 7448]AGQ50725.1 putative ICEF Integrative Conjugal Element - IIC [Mesomycoplasma hyopneumoniae 7422]
MAGLNNEVLVLFKGAFKLKSKDPKIRAKFKAVYLTKNFLEYISRLEACIAEQNNYLVDNFWLTAEDKSARAYVSHLKSILDQQKTDIANGVIIEQNLLQILPNNESKVVPLSQAKNIKVRKEQTVWSYVISFNNFDLLHKNQITTLKQHGKYLSPEINKWLKLNNLKAKDLNIFAAINYNTNHPHIHLWISEKGKTVKFDRKLRFDKRERFRYTTKLAEGILRSLSPKQNLDRLYDLVKELREIKKETKKAIEEFDLQKIDLDSELKKSIIEYSEIYSENLNLANKNLIDKSNNLPDLFNSIKKSFQEKNFPSLSFDSLEKDKVLKSNLQKRSKFFKYLDESKKGTINLILKKVLDSDLQTKNLVYRFNETIDKINEYRTNQDFEIISYAKNIVEKEEKEFFYQNRNVILKKLNAELDFEMLNRKHTKNKKIDLLKIGIKNQEKKQKAYFSYSEDEKDKDNINLLYWYKKTIKKIAG